MTDLFAGVLVSDRARAERWWSAVLGSDPLMHPNEREVVWEVGERAHVYVEVPADGRARGHGRVTLFLDRPDELDGRITEIARHRIEPTSRESYDNGVRKVTFTDPDGNTLALACGPTG